MLILKVVRLAVMVALIVIAFTAALSLAGALPHSALRRGILDAGVVVLPLYIALTWWQRRRARAR